MLTRACHRLALDGRWYYWTNKQVRCGHRPESEPAGPAQLGAGHSPAHLPAIMTAGSFAATRPRPHADAGVRAIPALLVRGRVTTRELLSLHCCRCLRCVVVRYRCRLRVCAVAVASGFRPRLPLFVLAAFARSSVPSPPQGCSAGTTAVASSPPSTSNKARRPRCTKPTAPIVWKPPYSTPFPSLCSCHSLFCHSPSRSPPVRSSIQLSPLPRRLHPRLRSSGWPHSPARSLARSLASILLSVTGVAPLPSLWFRQSRSVAHPQ